ncbi:lipoprotein [Spirochaetia bacterium]|nr:lipoprotein [Spirochaetia bacterium]
METILAVPENILGKGLLSDNQMIDFLLAKNPELDTAFAKRLSALYIKEAAAEGVNHDIAFSQMCTETNFLKFNKIVTREQNNFGGIGALSARLRGESFPSEQIGVRAQIQHLKGYATAKPLTQKKVDPYYDYITIGSAPTIYSLSQMWSTDAQYGDKIENVLDDVYALAFGAQKNLSGQILSAASMPKSNY